MAFLSQQFHYNKKTPHSVSGGPGGVGLVVSTNTGVDNVADNNVTELTNNLDGKNFSCISWYFSNLEHQIPLLKNSLPEKNAEHLSLAIELKQLKKYFKKVNTELKNCKVMPTQFQPKN